MIDSLETLLGLNQQGVQARPQSTMSYLSGMFGDDFLSQGGAGQSPAMRTGGAPSDIYKLAKKLERMGFDVGELEGFQGEGQINSGHVNNSLHYSGDAMDVNYRGGGRWGNETQALNWLNRWLNKRYDLDELLWQTEGHYDHLHAGGF